MNSMQPAPTARQLLGDTAPKLLELTEQVLFGDIWERPGLSKRDRSLITIAAIVALNRTQQVPFYLERAFENGVTKDELVEAITHVAFYAGWPSSISAVTAGKEVFDQHSYWRAAFLTATRNPKRGPPRAFRRARSRSERAAAFRAVCSRNYRRSQSSLPAVRAR